ncbi:MAG: low molecular weight phosphotyrosine protein phosphatase [Muribaculum sp.]|nr:low molecular weight phosphotyrosine protein phosphatase [Muribaculum sp.]
MKGKKHKILFVCLGNICRSPAAEGVMLDIVARKGQEDEWEIDSAGTGRYHIGDLPDHRMRIHARQRGLELTHICRQVTESDFDHFNLIIGMDESNLRNLHRIAPSPEAEKKIHPMASFFSPSNRWDFVPDPYYEGSEGFELVLDLLQEGCENIFNMLDGNRL